MTDDLRTRIAAAIHKDKKGPSHLSIVERLGRGSISPTIAEPAQNRLTAETFRGPGEFDQPSEWGKAASA